MTDRFNGKYARPGCGHLPLAGHANNRAFSLADDTKVIPVMPLGIQAGDRVVVEVGAREATTSTSQNARLVLGDDHADDLAVGDVRGRMRR